MVQTTLENRQSVLNQACAKVVHQLNLHTAQHPVVGREITLISTVKRGPALTLAVNLELDTDATRPVLDLVDGRELECTSATGVESVHL